MATTTTCFAHHHMTPAEYGFWQLCRDLSYKKGILYFDGRNMVKRFAGTARNGKSKNYFYSMIDTLTSKGWFEMIEPRKRNLKSGLWMASVYRVLSHTDWVACRGGTHCTDEPDDSPSSPDTRTGDSSPVPIARGSNPNSKGVQSRQEHSPVLLSGHNPIGKPDVANLIAQPDADSTPLSSLDSGTRIKSGRQDQGEPVMGPASPTIGTGLHTIPDYAEYDPSYPLDKRWGFKRNGARTTAAQVAEIQRLNRERVRPTSTLNS